MTAAIGVLVVIPIHAVPPPIPSRVVPTKSSIDTISSGWQPIYEPVSPLRPTVVPSATRVRNHSEPLKGADVRPARKPAHRRPDVSPFVTLATKKQQLFLEHAGDPGDDELAQQYDRINATFFAGALPKIPVVWESRLRDLGPITAQKFVFEGVTNGRLILLNSDLHTDASELTRTLCHEMVHVFFDSIGDKTQGHGPGFQSVLRRLSDQGAFEGLFATPEEKARLGAALALEESRLEREKQALEALHKILERARQLVEGDVSGSADEHRSWFNGRVKAFSARTERFSLDVEAYNAELERYKLMMSYPDGLDAELLARPEHAR
jgi:hypothetical protein